MGAEKLPDVEGLGNQYDNTDNTEKFWPVTILWYDPEVDIYWCIATNGDGFYVRGDIGEYIDDSGNVRCVPGFEDMRLNQEYNKESGKYSEKTRDELAQTFDTKSLGFQLSENEEEVGGLNVKVIDGKEYRFKNYENLRDQLFDDGFDLEAIWGKFRKVKESGMRLEFRSWALEKGFTSDDVRRVQSSEYNDGLYGKRDNYRE